MSWRRPRLPAALRRGGRWAAGLADRARALAPVRAPGVALGAASAWATWSLGAGAGDHVLYPAGLCGLALVALCAACVLAAALRLRLALRGAAPGVPEALETGAAVATGFAFPRLRAWPLVEVDLAWAAPTGVEVALVPAGARWAEEVTAGARGRHARVVRRFTVEDILGLAAITFEVGWPVALRISPAPAVAAAALGLGDGDGDAVAHPAGRPAGDPLELRAYGPGDPVRMVLWKAFARTRRLLVRVPERALAPRPASVALLVAGPGDEPAAAVARRFVEATAPGRELLFAADGAAGLARDPHAAVEQIVDSARAEESGEVLARGGALGPERLAGCVVFVPAVDGPWRARLVAFARALPAAPTVVIGVDGDDPPPPRGRWARALLRDRAPRDLGARARAGVPALRGALEADGLRVQVVHRARGPLP